VGHVAGLDHDTAGPAATLLELLELVELELLEPELVDDDDDTDDETDDVDDDADDIDEADDDANDELELLAAAGDVEVVGVESPAPPPHAASVSEPRIKSAAISRRSAVLNLR
jgi:hypothetical protein